jgi:hypothetical protein
MSEQDDIDSAAEHQQMQTEQRQRENSGVMDTRCFTQPFPPLPRLTPKEQFEVEMANIKALDWMLDKLFR